MDIKCQIIQIIPIFAHESDVWLSLLFTSFAVARPFNVQHSAIAKLFPNEHLLNFMTVKLGEEQI